MLPIHFIEALRGRMRRRRLVNSLGCIGKGVELDPTVKIISPEGAFFGNHLYVGPNTTFYCRGRLEIEDHVIISAEVIVMTSMHRYQGAAMLPYDEIELLRSVRIGRGSWIGMRAIILSGVELGEGCIIGAGSVVTRSWEDGSIIAGNPAKLVKRRDMAEFRRLADANEWYLMRKQKEGFSKQEIRVQARTIAK
jgi:acetyltransferase-like isoleucine patch superfamily enzyme